MAITCDDCFRALTKRKLRGKPPEYLEGQRELWAKD